MTLKELREKLKADRAKAADLRTKALGEAGTAEDRKAYSDAVDVCVSTLELVKIAEKEEQVEALATVDAGAAGGQGAQKQADENDHRVYAAVDQKMTPTQEITLMAAAAAKSRAYLQTGVAKSAVEILGEEGYAAHVKTLLDRARAKAARTMQKTNSTLTSADGGILLPTPNSSTIIEFLRPENTFLQAGRAACRSSAASLTSREARPRRPPVTPARA